MITYFIARMAQILGSPDDLFIPNNRLDGAEGLTPLNSILNLVYYIAAIVAIVMIIISGMAYVTANGDASKVAKAKNTILYSVIGLIVVLIAFALTNFILQETP